MRAVAPEVRPGFLETTAMTAALFFVAAGVPWVWTVVRAQEEVDTGGDAAVSVLFMALAAFLGVQMNGRWREALTVVGREPLLLVFLWWAFVSVIWSEEVALSLRRVVAMGVTTYFGIHLVLRFSQFSILRMLAGALALIAFVNFFWIVFLPQYSGPATGQSGIDQFGFDARLTGIYDNANSLGRVMALGVFTMFAAIRLDRRRRPLYIAGITAALLNLLLSQSKTSLVVSVLTTVLLIVFLVFRSRRQLFGAVVISVLGSAAVSMTVVLTNLASVTTALDRDITLSGRIPLWKDLLRVFPERPITGWGFNGYWNGWGSGSHEIWNMHQWLPPHGHNQFIDVFLALGAVGGSIYVALMIRTFTRATRHVRDVRGVFGLWPLTYCCFFLLVSLTEAGLVSRDITWLLYVSVVVLVGRFKGVRETRAHLVPEKQLVG